MKLLHVSDLHIGKRLHDFSMLQDQEHILREILHIADEEAPDAVLIAGDIYDRAVPPAEAVALFGSFLSALAYGRRRVFAISGNHDSAARVSYGAPIMKRGGVHLTPADYDGSATRVTLTDDYGDADIFLLPFIKPIHVRQVFPDEDTETYTASLEVAIRHLEIDESRRNILVAHQFVTGAVRSDSEEVSVGGLDNVDAAVFAPFDYVALGHLHRPQSVSPRVRYSGSPLAYSFSEAGDEKSVTIAELKEKGTLSVRAVPLTPRRHLREIRGSYEELVRRENYEGTAVDDYLRVTLTDEAEVPDALGKLRTIYQNIMRLDYDIYRVRAMCEAKYAPASEEATPFSLIADFYEAQNGVPMNEAQEKYVLELIDRLWEEEQ